MRPRAHSAQRDTSRCDREKLLNKRQTKNENFATACARAQRASGGADTLGWLCSTLSSIVAVPCQLILTYHTNHTNAAPPARTLPAPTRSAPPSNPPGNAPNDHYMSLRARPTPPSPQLAPARRHSPQLAQRQSPQLAQRASPQLARRQSPQQLAPARRHSPQLARQHSGPRQFPPQRPNSPPRQQQHQQQQQQQQQQHANLARSGGSESGGVGGPCELCRSGTAIAKLATATAERFLCQQCLIQEASQGQASARPAPAPLATAPGYNALPMPPNAEPVRVPTSPAIHSPGNSFGSVELPRSAGNSFDRSTDFSRSAGNSIDRSTSSSSLSPRSVGSESGRLRETSKSRDTKLSALLAAFDCFAPSYVEEILEQVPSLFFICFICFRSI